MICQVIGWEHCLLVPSWSWLCEPPTSVVCTWCSESDFWLIDIIFETLSLYLRQISWIPSFVIWVPASTRNPPPLCGNNNNKNNNNADAIYSIFVLGLDPLLSTIMMSPSDPPSSTKGKHLAAVPEQKADDEKFSGRKKRNEDSRRDSSQGSTQLQPPVLNTVEDMRQKGIAT